MSREAMQLALEALDSDNPDIQLRAATYLRQALVDVDDMSRKRVEEKAKREHEWVGLTDDEMEALFLNEDDVRFARYIESRLKDKNA
jgi:hypothetical protein